MSCFSMTGLVWLDNLCANIHEFNFRCKQTREKFQNKSIGPYLCSMQARTYKQERSKVRCSQLIMNCCPIGVWSNLKKLTEDMRVVDAEFLSYSSVSKRRLVENPIRFSTSKGEYQIFIGILK